MSIPLSMLESLQRHGDDSALLAPQIDAVSGPMVEGRSNELPWRMVEYDVDVRDLKITG